MSRYLVTFSSLNQVSRIKRCLQTVGVYADMIRTPSGLSGNGCGFSLRGNYELIAQVHELAQNMGIDVLGIFMEVLDKETPDYIAIAGEGSQ
jgi:hypothetical protein